MTQSSWPFDPQDTTETQYSQIFRRLVTTGVWGDPSTNDLKVTADSTGMNVKVGIGFAFVRGHMYYNDAVLTLPIDPAGASDRRDCVVLRLDPNANSIIAAVVKGTTNTRPTLVQTDTEIWEMPLSDIPVGASVSTISADKPLDARVYSSAPFDKWTTATRPSSPRRGDPGFNFTTGRPEYWDGNAWTPFAPTAFNASAILDPQNLNVGRINGKRVTVSNTGAPSGPAVGDVFIDWS